MDLLFLEKVLVGLFASVLVAVAVSKLRGRKLRLPPGPVPVPIFGNWLQVGDDLNHRNLAALARRFGEIFLLRMGQRNVVVVSSPALAREVLHARGAEFGSRGRNVVFDVFTDGGQDMVFAAYGDHWRTMRRVMTAPFFTGKVVQRHHAGWEAEAAAVVDAVRADPAAATGGVVLRRHMQLMMYNNMYGLMFGRRFEGLDDPLLLRLRELNGERSRLAQSFEYNYGDFIPVLRPFLRGYLKICKEVKDARLKLYKDCFVEERRKMLASGKATDSHDELKCGMDEILEAQRKGEINEDHVLFIVENINVAVARSDRDDAVGGGVGGGRAGEPPGDPAEAAARDGRRAGSPPPGHRARHAQAPLPAGRGQGGAPAAHGHPAAGAAHEPPRRRARRPRRPRREQGPRQRVAPRQRPRPVGAARRVPPREVPGGGEARRGRRQRLQVPPLRRRPQELPGHRPRAAIPLHHRRPPRAELRAAAAARAGHARHHREGRAVQPPHPEAFHHRGQAEGVLT